MLFDLGGLTGNGTVTVQVQAGTATDLVGNGAGASLVSQTITVDNTAPTGAVSSMTVTTANRRPTLTGTNEAGASVDIYEGATLLGSAEVTDTTWSFTPTADLAEGVTTLDVTFTDQAGNSMTIAGVSVTVDTTAPVLTVDPIDTPTSDTTVSVVVSSNEPAVLQVLEGTTVLATSGSLSSGLTLTTSALSDGSHSLTVVGTDDLGNVTTTTAQVIVVDTTVPTVTLGTPSATVVNEDDTPTIVVTYADSGSGIDAINLSDGDVTIVTTGDATALATVSGDGTSSRTITVGGISGNGTVTVQVQAGTATDLAGNAAGTSLVSQTITVDNTAPTGAITSADVTTANRRPTLAGTVESGSTVDIYNGTTLLGSAVVTGTTWTFTPAADLTAGTYNISATITDPAGNSTTTPTITVTVDLSGPTATIAATGITATTATFTVTFSAPVTGFSADDITVGGTAGGTKTVTVTANGTNTVFTVVIGGLAAPSGTVTISVGADAATAGSTPTQGGSGNQTFTVTVTPPSSSGGGSGGGCGAGGALGLVLAGLALGLRRRRI